MDEASGTRLSGIRQIVRLKEILQKWQSATINPGPASDTPQSGTTSSSMSSMQGTKKCCESDEENCQGMTSSPPADVPKGYLAVNVGPELRRFIIPTSYLTHSLFKVLLEKTEEEFGFDHGGALTIPCEVETFKYLLKCMEKENHHMDHPHEASAGDSTAIEE